MSLEYKYQDILIFPTPSDVNSDLFFKYPPVKRKIKITDKIWIGKLPGKLAEKIFNAYNLEGFKGYQPVRQFGEFYSFVKETSSTEYKWKWDEDGTLFEVAQISRLIHPTSIDLEYAAKITSGGDFKKKKIDPVGYKGMLTQSFLVPNNKRNWLTSKEAAKFRFLYSKFKTVKNTLNQTVKNALWNYQYSQYIRYADLRIAIICFALESLLNTSSEQITKQFKIRLYSLANELGLENFTEKDAGKAYEYRSKISHGKEIKKLDSYEFDLFSKVEEILRLCIKRCILDKRFRNIFNTEESIRKKWPILI